MHTIFATLCKISWNFGLDLNILWENASELLLHAAFYHIISGTIYSFAIRRNIAQNPHIHIYSMLFHILSSLYHNFSQRNDSDVILLYQNVVVY